MLTSLSSLRKPEELEFTLFMVDLLARLHPEQMAWCLPDVIPVIIPLMTHIKANVWKAAGATMNALCDASGNRDIQPVISDVFKCIRDHAKVCESIERLSSVVFVQAVETPVLAVMTPILVKGLKSPKTATQRRACTIAGNMVKMVPDAKELSQFVPQLLPLIDRAQEEISDPEARNMAKLVFDRLKSVEGSVPAACNEGLLLEKLRHNFPGIQTDVAKYAVSLSCSLGISRCFDALVWHAEFALLGLPSSSADLLMNSLRELTHGGEDEDASSEEGLDLCNCTFTLGYGNLALLSDTRLHLKVGKVYGLLGPNGCGKTTLLRAISNEQVEGFPSKNEVLCAFIEHGGVGESEPECDLLAEEYIITHQLVKRAKKEYKLKKEDVRRELEHVGFRPGVELDSKLGCLSAGWKVKVGLVLGMMSRADVLLFDEPTNHLDVGNAAWLADYINGLVGRDKPVTVIMNSHDSLFLERTCTHIITYEGLKLVTRRGRLSEVVAKVPSAKKLLRVEGWKVFF
jgi:elongation factor 3